MKLLSGIMTLMLLTLLSYQSNLRSDQRTILSKEKKAQIINEEWEKRVNNHSSAAEEKLIKKLKEVAEEKIESDITLPSEFCQKMILKADNIPFKTILKIIEKITGHNVIYGPQVDIDKLVSVELSEIEVWRALNTILYPLSYGFRITGKDLIILAIETKSFRVYLPPITQSFSDTTSNESFSASTDSDENSKTGGQDIKVGTKILVESKIDKLAFWDDIESNIKRMISTNGVYVINKTAGIVTVTDSPGVLDKLNAYCRLVNSKISQQVVVNVKVAEVKLARQKAQGIDWNAVQKKIGSVDEISLISNFGSGNIASYNITGPKTNSGTTSEGVNAVLRALESQGEVEIISQPKVMLLNNQVAVIQVGTVTAYVDKTSTESTQAGGTITSVSTSQVQEGVTMRLTANVVDDDIYLSVSPVITTVDQIREVDVGTTKIEAPQTTTKSINTLVKAKDGQTVVIGGLITSRKERKEDGIPFLSKIPILGYLFGYKSKVSDKTELVIFITPKKGISG